MKTPLRHVQKCPSTPLQDENCCICGLVDTWKAIDRVPGHKVVGPKVASLVDDYLDANPSLERMFTEAIGSKIMDATAMEHALIPLRCQLAKLLAGQGVIPSTEPVAGAEYSTPIRGHPV